LALQARLDVFTHHRQDKRKFIERIGLDWSTATKATSINLITTVYLRQLPKAKEYPPRRKWVYESETIYTKWRAYIEKGKLPDKREEVRGMCRVDPTQLQLDIGPRESAIVYDNSTHKLVALVIRNFTMEPKLLAHVEVVIKHNLQVRQDIHVSHPYSRLGYIDAYNYYQLRDPGKIIQTGISAGARHKPIMDWVRNILRKQISDDEVDQLDRKTAHVFSLFWMLIRKKLPDVVSDDIIDWLSEYSIHRMSKDMLRGLQEESSSGEIELDIGDELFTFHNAEFAPPSGVIAANYSRFFVHFLLIFQKTH
jgi:hypothetical protein